MRYVGVRDNRVTVVSNTPFNTEGTITLKVEDDSIPSESLICDYKIRDGQLVSKYSFKDPTKLRLALVGNWKMQCGISTYSENLWPEVAKQIGHVKLFTEQNDNPTSDPYLLGQQHLETDQVSQCWKRGQPLGKLVEEIQAYDPDIVWIQHEYGIWPNARHWLSLLSRLSGFRVICTLHSVFPKHPDKAICEAAIPEIIVHLEGARKCLKDTKAILGQVHVIPHGCYPSVKGRFWNRYGSEHTVFQFGFGFRYKGWEQSLHTIATLKKKYSDVFFTGLFSESPFAKLEHHRYHAELVALIDKLGIQDNVALIRGFQSDQTIDAYLRTNRITLFPYVASPEHEVFGASGAARMAMSKGVPVVTSTVNHFSDLPTVKADTPEELAAAIDLLFSEKEAKKQIALQDAFIEETSWARVAARHIEVFKGS